MKDNFSNIIDVIKNNQNSIYKNLISSGKRIIRMSDQILSYVTESTDYISKNEKKVEDCLVILNSALDSYSEMSEDFEMDEKMKNGFNNVYTNLEKNFRNLSFIFYKYMFETNKKEIENSIKKNNELQTKISQFEEKILEEEEKIIISEKNIKESEKIIDNLNNRVEGLGATFLNIVLTISIVSSMIAVLINVKPEYAIMIVVVCAWILLSSILFISEYYKSDKNKFSFGKIVYINFSIVAFFIIVLVPYLNKNKGIEEKTYFVEKESVSQYISIENKDTISKFLNNFSSYWKNNDDAYINNLEILNIDYISKIIFYKRTKGNLDYYDYEILLVDNKSVVLKLNSSDLKEWLYQNNLLFK